jgi:signal peptidase I
MSGYPPRVAPDDRHDDPADDGVVSLLDEKGGSAAGRGHGDPPQPAATTDAITADDAAQDAKKKPSHARTAVEWVLVLGAAVAVALILRTFLLSAFYIPSGSMEPTLDVGDRVLVNKLSYRLHDVNRGDIVVFERPPNEPDSSIKDLIKRVIGLPGETIEGADGTVYVCEQACEDPSTQGRPLTEGYVNPLCLQRGSGNTSDFDPVSLGSDQVWVMGDNRCGSSDSRVFGPIDEDTIVGRAFITVWPLNDMGWL